MLGYLLSTIAYVLMPIVGLLLNAPLWIYLNKEERGFYRAFNDYFKGQAIEVDRFANYHFRTLWNTTLKKDGGYEFGDPTETISSALGRNQVQGTLSVSGWVLNIVLWIIDVPLLFKGGHSKNAIGK